MMQKRQKDGQKFQKKILQATKSVISLQEKESKAVKLN